MRRILGFFVIGALHIAPAFSFDWVSHAKLTALALDRMNGLAENGNLWRSLGIDATDSPVFMTLQYFDGARELPIPLRQGLPFEASQMSAAGVKPVTAKGWLARGSVREDDNRLWTDDSPKGDDPNGDINRVLRHFYDPVSGTGLRYKSALLTLDPCSNDGPSPCATAIDWALGTTDYRTSLQAASNRRNNFTLADAREAVFRALTGYDATYTTLEIDPWVRQRYWTTAFRSLGDVLHLVQDMAQPQHTRNDLHAGILFAGDKSVFEWFVEANLAAREVRVKGKAFPETHVPSVSFNLEGYPPVPDNGPRDVVRFPFYSQFWTTSGNEGLADYTNRGFFSVGTNLGMSSNPYTAPNQDPALYTQERVQSTRWDGSPVMVGTTPVFNTLYKAPVLDSYTSTLEPGVRLSARSGWDDRLRPYGRQAFTLFRENYIDHANLVLARAIGYSAGLLNHFFRGRLEIGLPPEQVYSVADYSGNAGFTDFKLMLKNVTPAIKLPNNSTVPQTTGSSGMLVAVVRYRVNRCLIWPTLEGSPYWDPSGSGQYLWDESCRQPPWRSDDPNVVTQYLPYIKASQPVPVPAAGLEDSAQPVVFHFSDPVPFNAIDVDLQVVYRGPLGLEPDDIAIGFVHMSEPTFFNFENDIDCNIDGYMCAIGQTEPESCLFNDSVRLPLPEATPAPGQMEVASIAGLKPGEYARVAFLTGAAIREMQPHNLEVVTNQNFPYEVDITYSPDGEIATWPVGPQIRAPLYQGRLLHIDGQPPDKNVRTYAWWMHGLMHDGCTANNVLCSPFTWAASACSTWSQPVDSKPKPATIHFPAS